MTNRRQFLYKTFGGACLISATSRIPEIWLQAPGLSAHENGERILVVVQLGGGNDGLNTVIPYGDDAYYRNRFTLAIGKANVLKIDDYHGWHPSLSGFARLFEQQQIAVVQGVGYPQPNRSHFESMDLWHTAHRVAENRQLGWIGRCLESDFPGGIATELPALHYGNERQPLALATRGTPVPTITSLNQFRLGVPQRRQFLEKVDADLKRPRAGEGNMLLETIRDNAVVALNTTRRLESIIDRSAGVKNYPGTPLGQKLAAVAELIDAGLPTRIYYVTHNGFDTHSNQLAAHALLLQELGDAAWAFAQDLQQRGHNERTAVFAFSEFGRRVRENASRGTDHGTAAPVFLFGGAVNAGLHGRHPSLEDLDDGDLKFSVDYRTIYATLLEDWLNVPSASILNGEFERLPVFRNAS